MCWRAAPRAPLPQIEDCIDEFIEFEFFHPISGLGPKEISQEEYQALRERLAPYRFDIAVDLRKHLDTRDVLRYTPARFLAGYDHMGQFPFLDISLEWEGDRHLQRKRSHVTDDLINLVEAIGTAAAVDRTRLDAGDAEARAARHSSPDDARALFDKPVVAVHPGVGNRDAAMAGGTFRLADRPAGGEERGQCGADRRPGRGGTGRARCSTRIANRDAWFRWSARRRCASCRDLLRACALYVGNNSGPKHIAAALGVPTIGIHSGVVDAIEWGPIGKRAVALRRNMTCSPCYLARHGGLSAQFRLHARA